MLAALLVLVDKNGLAKIPLRIPKLSASKVAPSLAYIFNLFLASGICTDD